MKTVQQYYDTFGAVYEAVWDEQIHMGFFDTPEKSLRQACADMTAHLADQSHMKAGQRLLDVGCGQGGADRLLASRYQLLVSGIDLSPVQIEKARQRAQDEQLDIQYEVGNMERLPFPEAHFAVVWCQESFSYSQDRPSALREFARVLQPGGLLLIEDIVLLKPDARNEVRSQFGGRTKIDSTPTIQELIACVGEAGFLLTHQEDLSSHMVATYRAINAGINARREELLQTIPLEYREALAANFRFPRSQALAEEGKIGDIAFWFEK